LSLILCHQLVSLFDVYVYYVRANQGLDKLADLTPPDYCMEPFIDSFV